MANYESIQALAGPNPNPNYDYPGMTLPNTAWDMSKVTQSQNTQRSGFLKSLINASFDLVGKNYIANDFAPNPDAIGVIGKSTYKDAGGYDMPILRGRNLDLWS